MTTCNRCGKLTYEGLGSCQYCGAPLAGKVGSGVDPKMTPAQPELPAWLESLRAGERPRGTTGNQSSYTIDSPVDKDALPSWMRPESAEQVSADQYAVRRPAAMPAPNTDGGRGIAASSLIDEQSLPGWMRGNESTASSQTNISAASLVQPDALPEWMKTAQQPVTPTTPGAAVPRQSSEPIIPPHGIAANSLVDPQAVPAWMSGQGGLNGSPLPTNGPVNMPAASLLDMNTLPDWLRESGQEQKPAGVEVNPPARPGQAPSPNGGLTAPSLIDLNALPAWLRGEADQGQGRASTAAPAARSFNVPPRVENVRVPSRPRGEMGPREQSEAAANVFASILGVASPVPNFPPQTPGSAMGTALPSSQGQPPMGGFGASAQSASAGQLTTPGYSGSPGAEYPGGYSMLGVQQPGIPQQSAANPSRMAPSGQLEPNAKAPKRGFLETIRSWFSR